MISADGNRKHIRNTPSNESKFSPLTIEDVRKLPGYENISDEMAQNVILQIEQLAEVFFKLAMYE